jgi:DNA-binding winged helix-turn-helix (wHTH) protein/ribosomal protein S27E
MYRFIISVFFLVSSIVSSNAQAYTQVAREKVAMRLIGHQILLATGDSTSRVLQVEAVDDRYRITFESDFSFSPETLVPTIERVMRQHKIANSYLVEVQDCDNAQVVYSYSIEEAIASSMIPCGGRAYPKACYEVLIALDRPILPTYETVVDPANAQTQYIRYGLGVAVILLLGLTLLWKRQSTVDAAIADDYLPIGCYQFDAKNNQLLWEDQKTELTHKEAKLLLYLHEYANTVLTREQLLEEVWGDEGDYIGRTLDVFISKLRKKLAGDDSVKIVNVRGVGYRLVIRS